MTAQEHLGKLASTPVRVEVEIGRTEISLRDLIQLAPGSLVAMPGGSGDFDVRVGGVRIGEAEPIRLERKAGVRVTRIIRPEDNV